MELIAAVRLRAAWCRGSAGSRVPAGGRRPGRRPARLRRSPMHGRGPDDAARRSRSAPGDEVPFVLTWYPSHVAEPAAGRRGRGGAEDTCDWWRAWIERAALHGRSRLVVPLAADAEGAHVRADRRHRRRRHDVAAREARRRAQLGLPVLLAARRHAHAAGAAAAAATTDEARAWRDWLLRAVAGDPRDVQIMYGCAGERRLTELELDWLPGYEGLAAGADRQRRVEAVPARRVRRGDGRAAARRARRGSRPTRTLAVPADGARVPRGRLARAGRGDLGGARPAAALRALEGDGVGGVRPCARRRSSGSAGRATRTAGARLRDEIHREVCEKGWDAERGTFTQSYGSKALDAATLLIPRVGLPARRRPARGGHDRGRAARARCTTASCCATRPTRPTTGCRPARARSCRAASGSPMRSRWPAGATRRARCSIACPGSQRRRSALGGVRPGHRPAGRQLPAGVHARRVRDERDDDLGAAGRRARPAPARR